VPNGLVKVSKNRTFHYNNRNKNGGANMRQLEIPKDIRWIGARREGENGFPIETSYFKTTFDLTTPIKELIITLSANNRFCLYVNGGELLRGPCRGDRWHQYCDAVDIAPYLKAGANTIAVKVTAFPPLEAMRENRGNQGPMWCMSDNSGPALLVWGEPAEGVDISTGRSAWLCKNDEAIKWNHQSTTHWLGCMEEADGARLPHGWQTGTDSGEGWYPALQKWDARVNLWGEIPKLLPYERPIKPMLRLEKTELTVLTASEGFTFPTGDEEITLPAYGTGKTVLDTLGLTTSFVYFHCKGGAGSEIKLSYAEAFAKGGEKGHRADTAGELISVTDVYRPGGGDEVYSPSWFRTFRFIEIEITAGGEPLTVYPLKLVETRYPLQNNVRFETVEPWVKPVWDISLRTLELCMHESYEDCPFYEQLQYTMDTRMQMLFTYALGNAMDMPLKAIHDFHTSQLPEGILQSRFPSENPQVIPGFSLHWIFMLKDYYMETADAALLERYRPTMEAILAWFDRYTGPAGLLEAMPYWNFADWADAWSDIAGTPRAALRGPSTIHNLTYACALDTASFIMEALQYKELAVKYRKRKKAVLKQIKESCWSNERGLYREGPGLDDEYTQHAQIWAVLSGLAIGERAKAIMGKVLSDTSLIPCSFVMQYYLFRALEAAGMYHETEKLWDMWKGLLDQGLTTVPELPGKYTRSDCHAWGALILHELPRRFLGVEPLLPGYKRITIKPAAPYIKNISGEVPTPFGCVRIRYGDINGVITIEGSTPVPANVVLPNGNVRRVLPGTFSFAYYV
jgi:hypothetical protein